MSGLTTHVLDTARGRPAAGMRVTLHREGGSGGATGAVTDADGRTGDLSGGALPPGSYRIVFDTGAYYTATGQSGFYPEVAVTITVTDPAQHYHVPLLLSPFAYSTYRGS